jgi:hypothetical protein
MRRETLVRILSDVAKPRGFLHRGSLFWRPLDDLVVLVELQGSQYGAGKYINVGATPSAMVTRYDPPASGYWGLCARDRDVVPKHYDLFTEMHGDHEDDIDPELLREPVEEIFDWLDEHLSDMNKFRRQILDGSFELDSHIDLMLRDWALGELKEPHAYFEGTRYYG